MVIKDFIKMVGDFIRSRENSTALIDIEDMQDRLEALPSGSEPQFGDDFPILDGSTHLWINLDEYNSLDRLIQLNIQPLTDDFSICWGDGTVEHYTSQDSVILMQHTYAEYGNYRIDIVGDCYLGGNSDESIQLMPNNQRPAFYIEYASNVKGITRYLFNSAFSGLKKIYVDGATLNRYYWNHMSYSTEEIIIKSGNINTRLALNNNYNLRKLDMKDSDITSVDVMANDCTNLREIHFPKNITQIGAMLYRSSALQKITIPGTVTSINAKAFSSCNNLLDIYVPWGEDEVANAPWGAVNSNIHYNYIESEE